MPRARYSELESARIALWGLGRETLAFKRALPELAPNAQIVGAIVGSEEDVELAKSEALKVVPQSSAADLLDSVDVVVRSPGVSIYRSELVAASAGGVRVFTPTGLWIAQEHRAPVIGISGTKGKSTTATMVARLITATGHTVELAGNIGRAAIDLEHAPVPDYYVLELSSYQIADLPAGPDYALLTNLSPEHPEWHGDTDRYYADKAKLVSMPSVQAVAINADDERSMALEFAAPRQLYGGGSDIYVRGASVYFEGEVVADASSMPLLGPHNLQNFCGALAVVRAAGLAVSPDAARAAVAELRALPHRLEHVESNDGRTWIDDSISTTAESALAALEAFGNSQIVLIAGGHDRGQDYTALCEQLLPRNVSLICLPETGARLATTARDVGIDADRIREVPDLERAVERASAIAAPDAVVLLSPAAPSYGQFQSFEDRGNQFKALVQRASLGR